MVDEPIHLVAYRPEWKRVFAHERERLVHALGISPDRIVHIGSTAVQGLIAKPIVDIMIGADDVPPSEACGAALVGLGYESLGEAGVPGALVFPSSQGAVQECPHRSSRR